jgi:chromosome segregation ATPase
MESTGMLRLHMKMAQLRESKDDVSVRLAEIERKLAQLTERVNQEPRIRRRIRPMYMKLKHDISHHKRTAHVALHKAETLRDGVFQTPIDIPAVERAFDAALKVSARVGKELTELNHRLDEILAACGPLS